MDLTTEKMERLASQAAIEAELILKILWASCDSNLLWRIVFSGHSNLRVIVSVDAHDFKNENLLREEIKRQLSHHATVNTLAAPRRTSRTPIAAFALDAFDLGMLLWKEPRDDDWGAEIQENGTVINFSFEAKDLTLAKLRLSAVARKRAMLRSKNSDLPSSKSLLDLWRQVTIVRPS
jgi:hypothetical protein